ncbi:NAD(P)H-hydrate dehydratase [Noviherbaspirillum sp.]|uniref:NAD(P)H-hydrate dehydratase n=1 Tax=Noviherbaspirillum sp. TaxID=1926288 RepID=UPI002B489483|nr:NAD(P)H-hydrate dehydratase [Noviherbaspirillum sp.]HJV81460.1 NAD(P)H-hydrate dehydratase [Noviherbaspirillum sp.]
MPSPTALYSVAEIRALEQAAMAALPPGALMQRAGLAAARLAMTMIPEPRRAATVLILAGPGNNGGDALEVAHLLADAGVEVVVMLCAPGTSHTTDAQQAMERARHSAVQFIDANAASLDQSSWHLIVDGLFGIGLTKPITGELRRLVEAVNALPCPILALDVPSGLDADTGGIVGDEGIAIRASHTITFIADKPGLHTQYGRDVAGEVQVADLEIDREHFRESHTHLNSVEAFASFLHPRSHNSHKGSYGDVIILGGAHGMTGAAILAARTAAKCGAGRVFAAFLVEPPLYDSGQPELMCRAASEIDLSSATIVAGPGLGMSRQAHDLLAKALHTPQPLVLDADALNLIAAEPGLQQILSQRRAATLMTPHPLEAARLLQQTTKEIQADRLSSARQLARQFNATVILKGTGSVIARADGEVMINTTGNPALATAGTGDVLAGICGALLAQHFPAWNGALAACWLHGMAADKLVSEGVGPIGLTASELIPAVRILLNRLTEQHAPRHTAR